MANTFQGLAQPLYNSMTFRPQSFTSTGAGLTVDARYVGTDRMSAILDVGAVNTFTSLAVKMQYSNDDSNWFDISGATFTTVTAANQTEVIDYVLPAAATLTGAAPIYVRAYATLVGTSALISCNVLGDRKFAATGSSFQASPATVN